MASNEHLCSDDSFFWNQKISLDLSSKLQITHLVGISFWMFRMAPRISMSKIWTYGLYPKLTLCTLANDATIYPVAQTRNLDVIVESKILSFSASKNQVFPVLSITSQIQPLFTLPTGNTLVQATGVSNLDYCTILPRCSPPVVKSPVTQSVLWINANGIPSGPQSPSKAIAFASG